MDGRWHCMFRLEPQITDFFGRSFNFPRSMTRSDPRVLADLLAKNEVMATDHERDVLTHVVNGADEILLFL